MHSDPAPRWDMQMCRLSCPRPSLSAPYVTSDWQRVLSSRWTGERVDGRMRELRAGRMTVVCLLLAPFLSVGSVCVCGRGVRLYCFDNCVLSAGISVTCHRTLSFSLIDQLRSFPTCTIHAPPSPPSSLSLLDHISPSKNNSFSSRSMSSLLLFLFALL